MQSIQHPQERCEDTESVVRIENHPIVYIEMFGKRKKFSKRKCFISIQLKLSKVLIVVKTTLF